MNLYNLEKLVKIEVCDFYLSVWYVWKPQKKFLGFITQEEGVYLDAMGGIFESKKIPDNLILKNGKLYNKPMVTLYYESKIEKTYRFETLKEANEFRDKVKELSGAKFFS